MIDPDNGVGPERSNGRPEPEAPSFGRYELSTGNRLLTNGVKVVPLAVSGARWCFPSILQAEFARCLAVSGRATQAIAILERAKINLDDENQLHAPECSESGAIGPER